MTAEMMPKRQLIWLGLMVLVLLSAPCTIFGAVVTAAEAWQEHAQARWPKVSARVDTCDVDQTSTSRWENYYHLLCRLSYTVGGGHKVATVYSRNAPSRNVWQYPPNQIAPLEERVDQHPLGTPITVRYNPGHQTEAVLVATDMPRGGPRTPNNLKLLEVCAVSFLVLQTTALITRPRFLAKTGVPQERRLNNFD